VQREGGETPPDPVRSRVAVATIPTVLILWIVLGVLVLLVLWFIYAFNRFVRLRNRVDNSWSQIDVQLRRRYDLIPNLIEAVKGYAAHERGLFEEVTRARAQAQQAEGVQDQAQAENQVTRGVRQLLAVAENYPQLKANQNFLALQEELTGTESKIAYSRQFYNDQVMELNTKIQAFPSSLVARVVGVQERHFFEIDEPATHAVSVDFQQQGPAGSGS
jgi:LemA protein